MAGVDEDAPPARDRWGAADGLGSGTVAFAEWLVAATATSPDSAADPASVDGRRGRVRGVLVAVVVVVVLVGTFVWVNRLGGEDLAGIADRTPAAPVASPVGGGESDVGGEAVLVTGTAAICGADTVSAIAALEESGRIRSGERAIAAFVAAFYHARSGVLARELVAPEATVADAASIQAQIDAVPPGTAYCAWIEAVLPGWYHLELVEYRPNQPTVVRRQRIATTAIDGRAVITAIIDSDRPQR